MRRLVGGLLALVALIGAPVAAMARTVVIGAGSEVYQPTIDRVVDVITREIGLPLPASVAVRVYETRQRFRQGLVNDAKVDERGADELARFAIGLARPGEVLLNGRAARAHEEWVRLVAHELTHVAQFDLAGGEGRADQWLAEGVAEYVAYDVLERLGGPSLAAHRDVARHRARNQAAFASARLDLDGLGTPRGFTLRHQREGSVETYHLAFLMVDYLVQRDGLPSVVDYFARLTSEPRSDAFLQAFGQSLDEFETEVMAYLQDIID